MHSTASFPRLKAVASRVLFHPWLGRTLARAYGNCIPSRGCLFNVDSPLINDGTKAGLWWGCFETADCRFVEAHWRSDLDTMQLGAGIGVVGSHMARKLSPGRQIVCVEANPLLMRILETNVSRNAPHVRKTFVNGAIDYSGLDSVKFESAVDFLHTQVREAKGGPPCSAPTVRLSELLEQHLRDDFQLQMDIEGAEAALLLSEPPATFRRCYQILAEFHQTTFNGRHLAVDDLIALAREVHGFCLADRYGPSVLLRKREV